MRKFLCAPFMDFEVDLDDPKTYDHLPDDIKSLRERIFSEIGYSYCYMNFWHKDEYDRIEACVAQKIKVESLVKDFTDNESKNTANLLWYKERLFIILDCIENMC